MISVVIVFKNGTEFTVTCKKFNAERDRTGDLVKISWVGAVKNRPLYVRLEDVLCIYQEEVTSGNEPG